MLAAVTFLTSLDLAGRVCEMLQEVSYGVEWVQADGPFVNSCEQPSWAINVTVACVRKSFVEEHLKMKAVGLEPTTNGLKVRCSTD